MKVREALSKIDLTTGKPTYDIEAFVRNLNLDVQINWSDAFCERVTQYPIQEWMCTDTLVGIHAYFMDGEPIAISVQTARKNCKDIAFLSKEAADKITAFILTLARSPDEPELVSLDAELPDFTEDHGGQGCFFTQFGQRISHD